MAFPRKTLETFTKILMRHAEEVLNQYSQTGLTSKEVYDAVVPADMQAVFTRAFELRPDLKRAVNNLVTFTVQPYEHSRPAAMCMQLETQHIIPLGSPKVRSSVLHDVAIARYRAGVRWSKAVTAITTLEAYCKNVMQLRWTLPSIDIVLNSDKALEQFASKPLVRQPSPELPHYMTLMLADANILLAGSALISDAEGRGGIYVQPVLSPNVAHYDENNARIIPV